MEADSLTPVAALLRERNAIDVKLAQIISRPMISGHLGEWIAAHVFDIELEASAAAAGIDGRFHSGPLQGRTVNIKWYLKREGLLDTTESMALERSPAVPAGPVPAAELAQIQCGHGIQHDIDQVVLGPPLAHVHRHQQRLITLRIRKFCGINHDPRRPASPYGGAPFVRQAENAVQKTIQ